MDQKNKQKVHEGLRILIEDEVFKFRGDQSMDQILTNKQKISNLITYTRQVNYSPGAMQIDALQTEYENKLAEFRNNLK
ncbi:MAG: hypothetical protein AABW67_01875 [Nanoarchaeota archaeon]